ncbi:hypothetical protein Tco_0937449 [Tanacetum coccineum]|uniref:Uncharacterized protein n=1 Tax=Tanacetum coccineum TaxID=301880 RepID=A0ABQ5DLC2_9ASTR
MHKADMTGNIAHSLEDFKDFDELCTFVEGAYGGQNTAKGIQGVSEPITSSQQDQDNQDCIVMPIWTDASYFGDAARKNYTQVEFQRVELGNIPQSYAVPTTPHTRIHKAHPIKRVIGDVQSSVQTRRMITSYSEQGFLSAIYEGKTHQDLYTCLFACFLSQEEPKRVSKALSDPAWLEAMQEELL